MATFTCNFPLDAPIRQDMTSKAFLERGEHRYRSLGDLGDKQRTPAHAQGYLTDRHAPSEPESGVPPAFLSLTNHSAPALGPWRGRRRSDTNSPGAAQLSASTPRNAGPRGAPATGLTTETYQ